MSSPTRYQPWRLPLLNGTLGQADEQEPDPDPSDPIDYASSTEGGAVQVGISVLVYAELLAGETVTVGNTGGNTPDDPSFANDTTATLGAAHFSQTNSERDSFAGFGTVSYWWAVDFGSAVLVQRMRVWNPVAVGSPGWITTGDWPTTTIEFSDDGSSWTSSSYVLTSQSVPTGNISPFATTATEFVYTLDSPSTHRYWRIFKTGSPGGFVLGDAMCSWYIDGASSTGTDWNPAPQANDGDVATSAFSDVTGPTLRVALFVERLIYRMDLDVGMETAGATAFELYGTDDASFVTKTLLATLSFTATGSYTLDTVTATWVPTASFQYYQLEHISGGGDDREFYEVRMYSSVSAGGGVTDHTLLSGRATDDQHPASAVTVADADDWFGMGAGTVEAVFAELGAKTIGYLAHGNIGATETFDAAYGYHSAVLDNNCTFTLTAAPSGTVSSLFLELVQDGTGGWTITLPASVVNKADLEADQDTTADETTFLVLISRDGGTTWYGGWWGGPGGGGSTLTVEDGITSVSPVDTIVFDGATVTDDTGGQVTVSITGGGGGGGSPSGAKVTKSTQNISTATPTVLTFDTEEYDDAAYHDAGAPTRLTIPATGRYRVSAGGFFGFSDAQELDLWIVVDANTTVASALAAMTTHTTTGKGISTSGEGNFTAGQYLTVRLYHDNGSTQAFTSAWFAIERLVSSGGDTEFAEATRTAGNLTTTSTSFVDATGMSVTLTTAAVRCRVIVIAAIVNSGGNTTALDIDIDGSRQGQALGLTFANGTDPVSACFEYITGVLSAGSHTMKLQWKVSGGTGTLYADTSLAPLKLQVIETNLTA